MRKTKKWYSFAENGAYNGDEPDFFDVTNKAWAKQLQENHKVIREEFAKLIEARDRGIIPYYNRTLASDSKKWNIFPLYIWGKKSVENCSKCPLTTSIIESIPGLTFCTFSILKAGTSIKPHYGDSNVMYRCHLTLNSNGRLPEMGMRVRNKTISWENAAIFAFCDAYEHEAWNHTSEDRSVLIVDILREDFVNEKKTICREVNAALWWQLKFQNNSILSHLPSWSRKLLMKLSSVFF